VRERERERPRERERDDSASILCITFKFHYLSITGILIFATNAVLELKL
jgi:hypothetical protein